MSGMGWLAFEALLALALLVFIVWWTMFSGRRRGERQADVDDLAAQTGHDAAHDIAAGESQQPVERHGAHEAGRGAPPVGPPPASRPPPPSTPSPPAH